MEFSQYAGLSSKRLDSLNNIDITKRDSRAGTNFSYNNNFYGILHNCSSEQKDEKNEFFCSNANYAGLESVTINNINVRNRRGKSDVPYHNEVLKDIIQNNVNNNEINNSKEFFSGKGHILTPKRCLIRHADDSEINKYFSTKYAVTDKSTGRTEIMVERKSGCSNVVVQNFSEFDAYGTYKKKEANKNMIDSFVHTIMGIVPKDGLNINDIKPKAQTIFTEAHRRDHIAPDNYWMCPTIESEKKKTIY